MANSQLDSLDYKILQMLSVNARKPYLEIARECNVSGAAIHQRIQKLINPGVLIGSESLVNPSAVGYETCAYVGFFLKDPSHFDQVAARLKEIPEVVECHFTTGPYSMLIKVYAYDNQHLMQLLNDQIQHIPGVTETETLISLEQSLNRQIRIDVDEE